LKGAERAGGRGFDSANRRASHVSSQASGGRRRRDKDVKAREGGKGGGVFRDRAWGDRLGAGIDRPTDRPSASKQARRRMGNGRLACGASDRGRGHRGRVGGRAEPSANAVGGRQGSDACVENGLSEVLVSLALLGRQDLFDLKSVGVGQSVSSKTAGRPGRRKNREALEWEEDE